MLLLMYLLAASHLHREHRVEIIRSGSCHLLLLVVLQLHDLIVKLLLAHHARGAGGVQVVLAEGVRRHVPMYRRVLLECTDSATMLRRRLHRIRRLLRDHRTRLVLTDCCRFGMVVLLMMIV